MIGRTPDPLRTAGPLQNQRDECIPELIWGQKSIEKNIFFPEIGVLKNKYVSEDTYLCE